MEIDLPHLGDNTFDIFNLVTPEQILNDYRLAVRSRQVSLLGRKEVMSGRAKFGIFGDGKEIPQLALARVFQKGDWRSGYYRDQTWMMAIDNITIKHFFAQLYAHTDTEAEPASGGRLMNAHFVSHSLDENGNWNDLTEQYNVAADISPTAGQMPRLVGLAQASRLFREVDALRDFPQFSHNGDEVAFGTIGNASTSEGMFWEAINAIGVLGAPAVISIWDDDYGISVSNKDQMVKEDLSALLSGFQREEGTNGYDVYTVHGWDYPELIRVYNQATKIAREEHVPALIHVIELTQPQGHSTSGSHERYKSEDRLAWEAQNDGLKRLREWIVSEGIATGETLSAIEAEETEYTRDQMKEAWREFVNSIKGERDQVKALIQEIAEQSQYAPELKNVIKRMTSTLYPKRKDIMEAIFDTLRITREENIPARQQLIHWRDQHEVYYRELYGKHIISETRQSPMLVREVKPQYSNTSEEVNAFQLLNRFFHGAFERDPHIITFGEDTGFLGGVNQTMAGMQEQFGNLRVSDTGIRETTIIGQAIGLALRGLRPIAEIQYLDYLLYALQTMSDDLATLRWRTVGRQKAPVIVRTRGHRLEGVWHSGSLMASAIHMLRGMHILVPRDMTRAAGFYNTLLQGDDPALVVEVLNGYRKKEIMPDNIDDITVPLGVPEVLREGDDVTLVTYGPLCYLALEAAEHLSELDIEVEVIDVQSLLPFDINGRILQSLKKTNRILFVDEDVPGGTTAYMMQEVLEKQGGYWWLDSEPRTLSATEHRPAYGTDGGYFSKPNTQTIFNAVYEIMHEFDPSAYPKFYSA